MLGLLLPGTSQILARHGYPVSKSQLTATSTAGNRIDCINGRPAFGVYRAVVVEEYGVHPTHEDFYDYTAHYPFGLITAVDVLGRIPVDFNEDGSLFCVGEVPPQFQALAAARARFAGERVRRRHCAGIARGVGMARAGRC